MTDVVLDPANLTRLGVVGLMAIIVTALIREWLVPGTSHLRQLAEKDAQIEKLTTERDDFKRLAMQSIDVAERTQRIRGGGFVGRKEHA